MVFNDHVMKERLPSATYKALHETIRRGAPLDVEVANVVANAMKDWAIEHGATHYTHWFQPHDGRDQRKSTTASSAPPKTASVIMEFSGKELDEGRAGCVQLPFRRPARYGLEARGYTAWDPTSYAFIKDERAVHPHRVLLLFGGEVLDEKTPLLRSMSAISTQACRILKLFGKTVPQVLHHRRAGAGVFPYRQGACTTPARGSAPVRAAHCSARCPPRGRSWTTTTSVPSSPECSGYMKELDDELWKLGIAAKDEAQ